MGNCQFEELKQQKKNQNLTRPHVFLFEKGLLRSSNRKKNNLKNFLQLTNINTFKEFYCEKYTKKKLEGIE